MIGVARKGDKTYTEEILTMTMHGKISTGSNNVFVNGRPVARVGDMVDFEVYNDKGDLMASDSYTIVSGSSTVFVNGEPIAKSGSRVETELINTFINEGSTNVFTS